MAEMGVGQRVEMGRGSSEERERSQSSGGTFLIVWAIFPVGWAP